GSGKDTVAPKGPKGYSTGPLWKRGSNPKGNGRPWKSGDIRHCYNGLPPIGDGIPTKGRAEFGPGRRPTGQFWFFFPSLCKDLGRGPGGDQKKPNGKVRLFL